MLDLLKNIRWNTIIISIALILAGIFLSFYPEATAEVACNIIGGAAIIIGIVYIIHYITMDIKVSFYRNDFIYGTIAIILGIIIIAKKAFFLSLFPTIIGIIILASGISKLQDGIDAARLGYSQGMTSIILSAISIILGIVIIVCPFASLRLLFIISGIALIYCGLSDLANTLYLSTRITEFKHKITKAPPIDAEFELLETHKKEGED